MHTTTFSIPAGGSLWRDALRPKEHGSWSLAFEPLALALLVAPSTTGALLATGLAAAFFARRPWRMLWREKRAERRALGQQGFALCAAVSVAAFAAAVTMDGWAWLAGLAPAALAAAVFAYFDGRGEGRAEYAELAGAAAFALTPIGFALAAGLGAAAAAALGMVMVARAVPSVAAVRAFLRAAKGEAGREGFALALAAFGLGATWALASARVAPWTAAAALAVLALRSVALLVVVRPTWRARTLGMLEATLGVAFVLLVGLTWL